jgi:N-acetyl-gamma-glutamylphosphate reductase
MSQARALLDGGARIVDFSADFRLKDRSVWEKWYKVAHASPELFKEAVYGLPEMNRERIRKARLVAKPGVLRHGRAAGVAAARGDGVRRSPPPHRRTASRA